MSKKPDDGSRPLRNAREEKAAQVRATGKAQATAYADAGYKYHRHNAARLFGRPRVAARVAFLQGQAAERAVTTVEDIARQLDDDRAFARDKESPAAAVTATMGKAKVLGLIVDRHLIGMKRIEDMNENELRALLGVLGNQDATGGT